MSDKCRVLGRLRVDVWLLAKLAAAGAFKPFIDRSYPFDRIVEAHRYVDTGRKKGNVVVTLEV
ncbi:zinc-binding dehydrogenase [Chamaesiphon sp. VAR_48_metabat_403]|uniref:zinc-binding dehydrogenase n=1 Tax=Chamaesiphon sp. VAR_48_metabat_403 TaxID=2964700 RepID=UPI00286E202B|nr:zinc-binding dehydrogenase [Chamaesiphon sp. VAR_48_metabat_403]